MPRYKVEVTYDMGMSRGGETHEFEAEDDQDARAYIKAYRGGDLSPIKRNVRFNGPTLSRVID